METERMLFWIGHGSFYIKGRGRTVFIDPFRITEAVREKADIVLITHGHFDHCVREDILKVSKPGTKIVAPHKCEGLKGLGDVTLVRPGYKGEIGGVGIEAVPAYNTYPERQSFHPKANGWVGYVVEVDGVRFYHAGDTDLIPEMAELRAKGIDVALLPIGGKFTMDLEDAIRAAETIGAKQTVPMHFKNILGREGSERAASEFKRRVKGALIMSEVQEPTYAF